MAKKNSTKTEGPSVKLLRKARNDSELAHLQGKHDVMNGAQPGCNYCLRRLTRLDKKQKKTVIYLKGHQARV